MKRLSILILWLAPLVCFGQSATLPFDASYFRWVPGVGLQTKGSGGGGITNNATAGHVVQWDGGALTNAPMISTANGFESATNVFVGQDAAYFWDPGSDEMDLYAFGTYTNGTKFGNLGITLAYNRNGSAPSAWAELKPRIIATNTPSVFMKYGVTSPDFHTTQVESRATGDTTVGGEIYDRWDVNGTNAVYLLDILSTANNGGIDVLAINTPTTLTTANLVSLRNNSARAFNVTSAGSLTISGRTNIIADNGTTLTYNGSAIGGGSSGNAITNLTGDVTASGPGSAAATVAKINGATLGTTTATSGNMLIATNSQWVSTAMSGDATIANSGALTIASGAVSSGKLASGVALANIGSQAQNLVLASPNGSSGNMSARALVAGDLPAGTTPTAANPTATVATTAVNGSAATFMRSDASPAIPASFITANQTNITAANPSATVGASAVNGSAATFMRSDAAPALASGAAVANLGFTPATNTYAGITNSLGFKPATNSVAGITNALSLDGSTAKYLNGAGAEAAFPTTFSGYGISDTSANLAAALTDETGTGKAVFSNAPNITNAVLVTPTIPYASVTNALALTGSTSTFLRSDGTQTASGSTPPTTSNFLLGDNAGGFASTGTSANLAATLSDETGTGVAVFGTAPTFTTSITITNAAAGTVPLTINHASGASADLLDANVGGTSKFKFDSTGALTLPNGTVSVPSINLGDQAGWYRNSSFQWTYASGAVNYLSLVAGNIRVKTDSAFAWGSGDSTTTADIQITRDSAAVVQFGADAATTTAQALKAHDGSGTDKDGASLTLEGGQSTGTGRSGALITRTALTSTTGSSANSYSTRTYQSAKPVDLTESSATLFANIAVASSKVVGAVLHCTVYANDGTDFQSRTSTVIVDAVNKAGTVTPALSQVDNTAAVSTGTLTCTYTAVANGAGVDIKANAVSSLTQTVLRCKWSIVTLNSDDVGTVTAQ